MYFLNPRFLYPDFLSRNVSKPKWSLNYFPFIVQRLSFKLSVFGIVSVMVAWVKIKCPMIQRNECKEKRHRPEICVKYFLSFPKKTCHLRKLRQTMCLLLNFFNDKIYSYSEKMPFGTWQNGKIGVLSILSFQNQTLALSHQFSLIQRSGSMEEGFFLYGCNS